jgi:hypothetical protein
LEQFLIGQLRLVRGDQFSAERELHHFIILARAKQHSDGWLFVSFTNFPVECFEIEV